MEQVYAYGYGLRRMASAGPKRIVLLGMWLIFGTQIPFLLSFAVTIFAGLLTRPESGEPFTGSRVQFEIGGVPDPTGGIIGLAVLLGILGLYATLLFKVTRNYIRARRKREQDGATRQPGHAE